MARNLANGINDKHELFCQEYLKDLNATQAAIRAGYGQQKGGKISAKVAAVHAARLLVNANVASRIQELMNERASRVKIEADEILKRIDTMANFDPALAYDEKSYLKSIHDIPLEVRKCIKSVKVFEEFEGVGRDRVKIGETIEVTWHDRLKANELLGRHLKLFTDKVELSGSVGLAGKLASARKRAGGKS